MRWLRIVQDGTAYSVNVDMITHVRNEPDRIAIWVADRAEPFDVRGEQVRRVRSELDVPEPVGEAPPGGFLPLKA